MNYTDLTGPEFQGNWGHDQIDQLTTPGFYKLPFRHRLEERDSDGFIMEETKEMVVQVLAVYYDRGAQNIVVCDSMHDYHYIFYYNGNEQRFKPNDDLNENYQFVFKSVDVETWDKESEQK